MPREERRRASGWDPQRITSGPAAIAAALKGRIHGCTRTNSRKRQILLLHRGRRPYMAQSCVALTCPVLERSAAIRPLRLSQGRRACRPQAQGDRCDRRSVHLFILHGVPAHIRSDNGQEFVAKAVQESIAVARRQDRLHRAGQSLGERLHRDATSCSTAKSSTRSERPELSSRAWRRHYNTIRPHASLGYKPPAPKCSCPPSPRGRLRYAEWLRPRWRNGQP